VEKAQVQGVQQGLLVAQAHDDLLYDLAGRVVGRRDGLDHLLALVHQQVNVVDDAVERVADLVADHVDEAHLRLAVPLGLHRPLPLRLGSLAERGQLLLLEPLALGDVHDGPHERLDHDRPVHQRRQLGKGLDKDPRRPAHAGHANLALHRLARLQQRPLYVCLQQQHVLGLHELDPVVGVHVSGQVQDRPPAVVDVHQLALCE